MTAADMLARASSSVGYYVQTFATFPSQIMGGPTWTQTCISTTPILCPGDELDVLMAFNMECYKTHQSEVRHGGVILHDSSFTPPGDSRAISVPFDQLAKRTGEARSANMVMMGALAHLMNIPLQYFEDFIRRRFKGRDAIIQANITALGLGYEHLASTETQIGELDSPIKPEVEQVLVKGNEALSLGALAAGPGLLCRLPHLSRYHHPGIHGT